MAPLKYCIPKRGWRVACKGQGENRVQRKVIPERSGWPKSALYCVRRMCVDDTKEEVEDVLKQESETIRETAESMRN